MKAQTLLANIRNKALLAKRAGLLKGDEGRNVSLNKLAEAHADWVMQGVKYIQSLAPGTELTADDVWGAVRAVSEPRAMGAVMSAAKELELIEPTGRYEKSSRPVCHSRPIQIWRRK